MGLIRVLPPANGETRTVFGRTYIGIPGTPQDVPDADANVLGANGWTICAKQGVGTTAQRPTAPERGHEFTDTTVGATIKWDGKVWRHAVTGAAV